MKLKAEDLARIEDKKLANVLRRLREGKTLTAREDAILAAAKAGGGDTSKAGGYAASWDELARALSQTLGIGISRRTLQTWRVDPRYIGDVPADRADGRKEVAAWLAFIAKHNLRGSAAIEGGDDENEDDGTAGVVSAPRIAGSQSDWTKAVIHEKYQKALLDRLTREGTLLVADELEVPLGATFAALQTKLMQFPETAARRVKGIRDERECADALRDEIDALLTDLNAGRFTIEEVIASAIEQLDPDAEALCQKLLFAGADRTALLELARSIATSGLRRLGQAALAHVQREAKQHDEALAHEVTGQVTEEAAARESGQRNQSIATPDSSAPSHPARTPRKRTAPAAAEKRGSEPIRKARKRTKARRTDIEIPPGVEGGIAPVPKRKFKPRS